MVGIKDFEIPNSCSDCPFDYDLQQCVLSIDAYSCDYEWTKERSPRCPLVEIGEEQND